jgi:aminoglycoside phosphotransferase (APT) family kinase protein
VGTVLEPASEAALWAALARICEVAGLRGDGARLIRYTMNAVWVLDDQRLVVRMTTGTGAERATSELVRIATILSSVGAPVVPLADVEQPVHAGEWSATFWRQLRQPDEVAPNPVTLVTPLRELHHVQVPADRIPQWDMVGRIENRLIAAAAKVAEARPYLETWASSTVGIGFDELLEVLGTRCGRVQTGVLDAPWQLPVGVVHGDAHTGNLLHRHDDRIVWCDLDSIALGPREWDLVPAAFGPLQFGRDRAQYDQFAERYGFDVMTSPAWPLLREIRELQSVTSVLSDIPGRPMLAAEVGRRLRGLLHDEPVIWHRYA